MSKRPRSVLKSTASTADRVAAVAKAQEHLQRLEQEGWNKIQNKSIRMKSRDFEGVSLLHSSHAIP